MTTPHDELNAWLDDHVSGRSTPEPRDSSTFAAPDLRDTAAQLHDLARRAARQPIDPSLPDPWEALMLAPSPAAASGGARHNDVPLVRSLPRARRPKQWGVLDRTVSLLVAAVLLIAISAGIWQAADYGNSPPPTPDEGISLLAPGTPETAATPASRDAADLPTAADCTVEPLTVDEVLWYVTDPEAALTNVPEPGQTLDELSTLEPGVREASQEDMKPSLATDEDIAAAAATQRMWMACILAESYFQVWALQSPYLVQSDVINRLPPLTGVEETRAVLEQLEAQGAPVEVAGSDGFYSFADIGYPGPGGVQLINDDRDGSWKVNAFTMALGFDRYEADGTFVATSNIFDAPNTSGMVGFMDTFLGCDGYSFEWSDVRAMWMITWAPSCG